MFENVVFSIKETKLVKGSMSLWSAAYTSMLRNPQQWPAPQCALGFGFSLIYARALLSMLKCSDLVQQC